MKKIFIPIIAILIAMSARGQNSITLEEAIALALKNKPAVRGAEATGTIARLRLEETKRKYTPEIQGELMVQYNPTIPTSIIPVGQFNTQNPSNETRAVQFGQPWSNTAGIRGKQVLFSPTLQGEAKERKLELAKAEVQVASEHERIIYEVVKAYYGVLLASEELRMAAIDTMRYYELHQVALQRFSQLRLKPVENKQAEYELINARFRYNKLKSNVENACVTLCFAMGLPVDARINLLTGISEISINKNTVTDSTLLLNRSDYQQAWFDGQLYQQQVNTERAKLIPELSLQAFVGANQFTQDFSPAESNTWFGNSFINLTATVPLSALYGQRKRIDQAKSRYVQNQFLLRELQQQFNYETKLAQNNIATAVADYRNQTEGLVLSKQVFDDVANRFKEGQSLSSEVQTAAAGVAEAQYRAIKSLHEVLLHQLEWDRLTGFRNFTQKK